MALLTTFYGNANRRQGLRRCLGGCPAVGYAEADPSADVDGLDAADKIAIRQDG